MPRAHLPLPVYCARIKGRSPLPGKSWPPRVYLGQHSSHTVSACQSHLAKEGANTKRKSLDSEAWRPRVYLRQYCTHLFRVPSGCRSTSTPVAELSLRTSTSAAGSASLLPPAPGPSPSPAALATPMAPLPLPLHSSLFLPPTLPSPFPLPSFLLSQRDRSVRGRLLGGTLAQGALPSG